MSLGTGLQLRSKKDVSLNSSASMLFDGTDDEVTASGVTTLAGASAFTLSGWFKKTNVGHNLAISYNQSSSNRTSINFFQDGNVYLNVAAGSSNFGSFSCASTDWVHLVMVFDGTASGNAARLKGYLDGVEQTLTFNSTIPATAHSQSAIFRIGKDEGLGVFSQGSIDEVSVFSSAFTAREVDALYNNGRPTNLLQYSTLEAWYRMGEGTLTGGKRDGDENLLFDQGPNGGLGSELVTNGTFDSANHWTLSGGTIIEDGVAKFATEDSSYLIQTTVVPQEVRTYELSYEVLTTNGNNFRLSGGHSAFGGVHLPSATVGKKSVVMQSNGVRQNLQFNTSNPRFIGSIDNVSLREVQNVGTINGAAIQADKPQELITNGTYDTDTSGWTAVANTGTAAISIASGKLRVTSSTPFSYAYQSFPTRVDGVYSFTVDVTKGTSPNYDVYLGTSQNAATLFNSGTLAFSDSQGDTRTITGTFTATSTTTFVHLRSRNQGSITDAFTDFDNVSVKEVTESVPKQVQNLRPIAPGERSLSFDGSDDVLVSTIPVLGDTHTISAWFNTTAGTGGMGSEATIVSYLSTGGGGDDSVLSVANNKLAWSDFVDDDQFGTSTVNDGLWHHGVVVVTATDQKLYVDGVLEKTTINSYSGGTSFSAFAIGRRADNTQRYFIGNLDEVALWNEALDSDAIKAIYNAGQPTHLAAGRIGAYDIYKDNLQAYYRADATVPAADGTSNLLFDQTNPGLGPELVTNGDFSSDSDWIKGPTWSIADGVASATESNFSYLYQNNICEIGKIYRFSFDVTKASGVTGVSLFDAWFEILIGATNGLEVGSYSIIRTAANTSGIRFRCTTGGTGEFAVDNVSVREVNGHTGVINGATLVSGNSPKQIYALPPVANTKSINFDGVDDHLVTQVDDTAQPNNESRYYSWWSKASVTGGTSKQAIFSHGDLQVGAFFFNYSASRPLLLMANSVYVFWEDTPTGAQDDGEWHHWVVKIKYNDITGCELWCDGVKQTKLTFANTGSMNTYTTGIQIGKGGTEHFNGSLDEFSIHEDLDDEAIRALFNRGRPIDISKSQGAYDVSDNALHWWRMGDATSPAADGTNDIIFQGLQFESDEMFPTNPSSSDWHSLNNMTWDGTTLSYAGTGGEQATARYTFTLPVGRTFRLTVDIENHGTGNFFGRIGDGSNALSLNNVTTGTYEVVHTVIESGANNLLFFIVNGGFTGSITNISLNEVRGQYIGAELVKADADLYQADTWFAYSGGGVDNVESFPNGTAVRFTRPSSGGSSAGGFTKLSAAPAHEALTANMETGCVYKLQFDFLTDDSDAYPRYYDGSSYTALSSGSGTKVFYFVYSGSTNTRIQAAGVSNEKFVQFSGLSVTKVGGAAVMNNMTSSDIQTDTPY